MSGSKDFMYGESPKGLRRNGRKNSILSFHIDQISIGNYTVREVLMKNRTRVWRNVYNTASIINISPNTSEIFH